MLFGKKDAGQSRNICVFSAQTVRAQQYTFSKGKKGCGSDGIWAVNPLKSIDTKRLFAFFPSCAGADWVHRAKKGRFLRSRMNGNSCFHSTGLRRSRSGVSRDAFYFCRIAQSRTPSLGRCAFGGDRRGTFWGE